MHGNALLRVAGCCIILARRVAGYNFRRLLGTCQGESCSELAAVGKLKPLKLE